MYKLLRSASLTRTTWTQLNEIGLCLLWSFVSRLMKYPRASTFFFASGLRGKTGEKHEMLYHCHCKQFVYLLWKCVSMRGQTVIPCTLSAETLQCNVFPLTGFFLYIQSLRESTVLFVFSGVLGTKRKLLLVICVQKIQTIFQNNVLHLVSVDPHQNLIVSYAKRDR